MLGYRTNRFAGIISRYDPREPLPADLEHAFHGSHALQVNSYLPHSTSTQPSQSLPTRAPLPVSLHSNVATYTIQEPSLGRNVLPPVSISIDASIIQDTASITVTQLFWNDSDSIIKEAAYTFPLSSGCTVTDFHCRIGHGKVLTGNVKPKEEARDEFQHHVRSRDTGAALLEQDTEEIFTTSLGNLPARTKIRVTVTYIALLKHHFADRKGTTTLTIPTCIASRYGDKPQDYNNAASTSIPEGLKMQIEVVEASKIASITSPTHKVIVENQLGTRAAGSFADLAGQDTGSGVETALVKLEAGSAFLDRDFVLDITTGRPSEETESPQAWIERHPTLPNQQALMLTIPPGFTTQTSNPCDKTEILLLADLSGSMVDKISSLRAAMQFFLKGIPNGRKFNIWCFGSDYKSWQPHSVDYGEASYHSAASWVDTNFEANMGGTELLPAVQATVAARDKKIPTDIIILTDGETWRLDETLEYIRKQRDLTEGRVRFFALGIGPAVSHALVEGIAKAGGGYAEVVREASEGDWEDRVVSMAEAALMTDHLGPMHLEVNITRSDGSKQASSIHNAEQSPADISTLCPFNKSRIFFLFDSFKPSDCITSITLKADTPYGTKSLHIPVTVLEKSSTTIHRLAARSLLDDLERGQSHIHLGSSRPYPGSWDERNRVRKEAEKIACKWSLVSKWTSFFLKEEPCQAKSDDMWCAQGGSEVVDEPGDDLLQPYGPTTNVVMVESGTLSDSASGPVLVGELVSTSRSSSDLSSRAAGRPLQRLAPGSTSAQSFSSIKHLMPRTGNTGLERQSCSKRMKAGVARSLKRRASPYLAREEQPRAQEQPTVSLHNDRIHGLSQTYKSQPPSPRGSLELDRASSSTVQKDHDGRVPSTLHHHRLPSSDSGASLPSFAAQGYRFSTQHSPRRPKSTVVADLEDGTSGTPVELLQGVGVPASVDDFTPNFAKNHDSVYDFDSSPDESETDPDALNDGLGDELGAAEYPRMRRLLAAMPGYQMPMTFQLDSALGPTSPSIPLLPDTPQTPTIPPRLSEDSILGYQDHGSETVRVSRYAGASNSKEPSSTTDQQQSDRTFSWVSEEGEAIESLGSLPSYAGGLSHDLSQMDVVLSKPLCEPNRRRQATGGEERKNITSPNNDKDKPLPDNRIVVPYIWESEEDDPLESCASTPQQRDIGYNWDSRTDQPTEVYTKDLPPPASCVAYSPASCRTGESGKLNATTPPNNNNNNNNNNNDNRKPWTDNRIISELLKFQSAKGYFAREYSVQTIDVWPLTTGSSGQENHREEHLMLLCDFLGKQITHRLSLLRDGDSTNNLFGDDNTLKEQNLFTIAICILLQRDFASKRSLWVLMRRKAEGYLKDCVKQRNEAFEKVAAALEGAKIEGYKPAGEELAGPLLEDDCGWVHIAVPEREDGTAKMVEELGIPEGEQSGDEEMDLADFGPEAQIISQIMG